MSGSCLFSFELISLLYLRSIFSIMGEKDNNRVKMVQFHQSYSYEDFIMGFRPTETGFELKTGVFYQFCKQASMDIDNDYFFIIDEINRFFYFPNFFCK